MKRYEALRSVLNGILWLGALVFCTIPLRAQCPNGIPQLSDYGTGSYSVKQVGASCLPLTVNVKSTLAGSTNVLTIFDFKGGLINPDSLKTDTLHTYTRPGKYTIIQFSEQGGRKLIACPTVYVYDTLPPKVRMVPCGSNQVKLIFEDGPRYDSHWILWSDGQVQEISPYTQSISHVFASPPPHTITVWGTVNPGLCRSREVVIPVNPTITDQIPTITALSSQGTSGAELTFTNPLKSELLVVRSSESGIWESTGRTVTKENEPIRVMVDSLNLTCFRLQATDTCLARYTSEPVCASLIQATTSERGNAISWKTRDVPTLARVTIMKDGTFWKDISAQAAAGILEDEELLCRREHCYQLLTSSPTLRSSSRILCRTTPLSFCGIAAAVFMPDAFSPNGDGVNDVLEVKSEGTSAFELSIFNTWGTLIFRTTQLQPTWDGKFQDAGVPSGNYPYILTTGGLGSKDRHTRRGTVLVIK